MKILHIDTEKGFRGGEQQVMLLMRGLREKGISQALLARKGGDLAATAQREGFDVHETPFHSAWGLRSRREARRLAAEGRFSIVHAHTGNAHTLACGAVLGRVPVVVTRRVDFPVKSNIFSRRKYTAAGVHFIAISRGVADVLRAGGVASDHISIVHSGIDVNRFREAKGRAEWRAKWQVVEPGPVIGTVGSYVDHKDPLNLVQAAKEVCGQLPNAKILFVGEGELRSAMESRARELGLQTCVTLTGWQDDVGGCLAAFDMFVMPSKLEGLCTSLLDAMAVGLPCVGTDTGGIPDVVIGDSTGMLVPAENPAALAKAVVSLWNDTTTRARLSEAGRIHVEKNFTAGAMVAGTEEVYQRVLASAGRR